MRIDVNYATLVLNVLCLEGLAGALQPGYELLDGQYRLFAAVPNTAPPTNKPTLSSHPTTSNMNNTAIAGSGS